MSFLRVCQMAENNLPLIYMQSQKCDRLLTSFTRWLRQVLPSCHLGNSGKRAWIVTKRIHGWLKYLLHKQTTRATNETHSHAKKKVNIPHGWDVTPFKHHLFANSKAGGASLLQLIFCSLNKSHERFFALIRRFIVEIVSKISIRMHFGNNYFSICLFFP